MRIARVLTRLNLGGPARQVLASDPLLVQRGHQLRVFAGRPEPGEGDLFDALVARGVDVVRVPGLARGWSVAGDLRARAFLRRELAAFAPQVLHTHASKAGALGRSAVRGRSDVARVHTFHGHVLEGYFGPRASRGLVAIERRLARDTDRIVAVSHTTADDLVRLGVVAEERLVVIPPGVDLSGLLELERRAGPLRELLGAGPQAFLVGVVGRLAEVKRPEWALDVLELLAARYPQLQVVYVGDGSLRGMLERRIRSLPGGLQQRAHLLGAREDMPAVLAELDALLLTSRSEGLPVALVEAAAAALPVVATRVGGVPEVVAEERTGWLGETPDELAYGLARLLDDPAGARAMGQRARLRVARRHDAPALAERLERLYEAVLGERA
jgi:glycosyltransferase involved in cell wall biosynthesis